MTLKTYTKDKSKWKPWK